MWLFRKQNDTASLRQLMIAIHCNDISTIKVLLDRKPRLLRLQDKAYNTLPLHRAVLKDQMEIVDLLISQGANVRARNKPHHDTPLHMAALCGYLDIAKLLILKGADVNARNRNGKTPLDVAAEHGSTEAIDLLLKYNARFGGSAVENACMSDRPQVVEYLLDRGFSLAGWRRKSPLHWAASHGCVDIVEMLIRRGADVNARDSYGRTPLHEAAGNLNENAGEILDSVVKSTLEKYYDVVTLLINNGADINARDKRGKTPMDVAVGNKRGPAIWALDAHMGNDLWRSREGFLRERQIRADTKAVSTHAPNDADFLLIVHDQVPTMRYRLINAVFDKLHLPVSPNTPTATQRHVHAKNIEVILPFIVPIAHRYLKECFLELQMDHTQYEPFKVEFCFSGEPLEPYEGYAFALFGR